MKYLGRLLTRIDNLAKSVDRIFGRCGKILDIWVAFCHFGRHNLSICPGQIQSSVACALQAVETAWVVSRDPRRSMAMVHGTMVAMAGGWWPLKVGENPPVH
jgi:hypothetical protein